MGKLSGVFLFLLMINIVGFILMNSMVAEGLAEDNPYVSDNSLLTTYYSSQVLEGGETIYFVDNSSSLVTEVPQETPSSLIQEGLSFVDRIFILFGFIKVIIGVLLFPVALISFMGLPWQLSMLLFPPLMSLYVLGIIDLVSGGSS